MQFDHAEDLYRMPTHRIDVPGCTKDSKEQVEKSSGSEDETMHRFDW